VKSVSTRSRRCFAGDVKDVLILLLVAAFFALCIAYVWWCDRIIGPDAAEVRADQRAEENV
jgi:hypothetical protein